MLKTGSESCLQSKENEGRIDNACDNVDVVDRNTFAVSTPVAIIPLSFTDFLVKTGILEVAIERAVRRENPGTKYSVQSTSGTASFTSLNVSTLLITGVCEGVNSVEALISWLLNMLFDGI